MEKIPVEEKEFEVFDSVHDVEGQVESIQKKYNIVSKNVACIVGKNLTLFICMLVPILLVGFIWTDFGAIVVGPKMFSDGIFTVALFVVGEIMMTKLGSDGGKLDGDFLGARNEYESLASKVGEIGTILMGLFCIWQIDLELEQAIQYRLRMIRMTKQEWLDAKGLDEKKLEEKYGKIKALKIIEINKLKPIELSENLLLCNGEGSERGGVPRSGDSYIRDKKHYVETVLACLFTGLLTITVVLTLTSDITVARVIYTLFKLVMLLFRMARGYDRGARAYNTIEVKRLKAKSNYLKKYIKFVEEKMYIEVEKKYKEGDCFCE